MSDIRPTPIPRYSSDLDTALEQLNSAEYFTETSLKLLLSQYQGRHLEVMQKIAKSNRDFEVLAMRHVFTELSLDTIVDELLRLKKGTLLYDYLDVIDDYSAEFAYRLIEGGAGWIVSDHLEEFSDLDYQKVLDMLFEHNWMYSVANNADKFQVLDQNEVAQKILDSNDWYCLSHELRDFSDLNLSIAEQLIAKKAHQAVSKNLQSFRADDRLQIQAMLKQVNLQ